MWHGYVERHTVTSDGRKRAGTETRLARPADVVLDSPDAVADWIRTSLVALSKHADTDAARKNTLLTHPEHVYRSTARRGLNVYASVHATRDEVWDVCAEVVS